MKWIVTVIVLFVTVATKAQIKDDISVVQYSAKFVTANEIDLKVFKDYNIQTLYMSENKKIFEKEKIKYLPTIILYNDGEVVLVVESGISLKLPEDTIEQIKEEIELILENRF